MKPCKPMYELNITGLTAKKNFQVGFSRDVCYQLMSINPIEFFNYDKLSDINFHNADIFNVWIAHISTKHKSSIDKSNHKTYKEQQTIVRKLLATFLSIVGIEDSCCYLKDYPYRLSILGYFICFSHTTNGYSVILSKQHAVGIDVESGKVSWRVANRYFHKNELSLLSKLEEKKKEKLCLQLWQIKECLIKINNHTLTAGMGIDLSFLIPRLVKHLTQSIFTNKCSYKLILTNNDKIQLNDKDKKIFNKFIHYIWFNTQKNLVAVF